jgi:hypothetical protein
VIAASIAISFPSLHDTPACRIDIPAASQPVYANRPKAERTDDFYVRSGNSTRRLTPQEVVDYLNERSSIAPA